jgi:hypothetical protein
LFSGLKERERVRGGGTGRKSHYDCAKGFINQANVEERCAREQNYTIIKKTSIFRKFKVCYLIRFLNLYASVTLGRKFQRPVSE